MRRRVFLLWGAAAVSSPAFAAERQGTDLSRAPSATARGAALHRAVHQVVDSPLVFDDPFAVRVVAPASTAELRRVLDGSPGLRASIVLRSRFAEDRLAAAVSRGVRQYVNLGAGLDTFACRNPHRAKGLRVFEVDHPGTQAFKRERLATARMRVAPGTRFVPVDFETQSLQSELRRAGFRFERPAFFAMLGVAIYLTHEAVMETLRVVARGAPGTEVAFDYALPEEQLDEGARAARQRSMQRMRELGEPWITFYDPAVLAAELRSAGFRATSSLAPEEANRRYFANRGDALKVASGHVMVATR